MLSEKIRELRKSHRISQVSWLKYSVLQSKAFQIGKMTTYSRQLIC